MRARNRHTKVWLLVVVLASVLNFPLIALSQAAEESSQTSPDNQSNNDEQAKEHDTRRKEFSERLRLIHFSSWARDTVVGLFFAREEPDRVEPTDEEKQSDPKLQNRENWKIKDEEELCALDAEVDLLASALLALREPDAVLNLYKLWYVDDANYFPKAGSNQKLAERGKKVLADIVEDSNKIADPNNWRTPAAPLIFAQAYRLRAWLRFFPRPDKSFQIAEESRVELFFRANVDLAKAANVLKAALGSFAKAGVASPEFKVETLARWASHYPGANGQPPGGLPKAQMLEDVRSANGETALARVNTPGAKRTNSSDAKDERLRVSLPAFRAVEFAVSYQEWLCRIYRELGDLVYRETGRSVTAPDAGSNSQPTALGWYSLARDHCYAGRLINYEHRGLRMEARELKDRLEWILAGRAFGGHELWRLSPLSTRNYVTPAIERLDVTLANLAQLQEKDAERTAGQLAVATDLQQRMADRKQLDQFYRFQAQRELTVGIMDLKSKVATFQGDMAHEDLERAENALQHYLLESSIGLSQQQYLGELERLQHQWLHQMLETAQQLQINGGFQDASETSVGELELSESTVAEGLNRMSSMPKIENPDQRAIDGVTQFLESLQPSPTQAELLKTWDRTLRPQRNPEIPRTTTAIRYAEWRAADYERARANLHWSLYKTKVLLREHQKRLDLLRGEEKITGEQIKGLWKKFRDQEQWALSDEDAKALETVIKPKLQEEVQHASNHLRRAVSELKNYQEKLAQVRRTVEEIKQARMKVEQAYESFVSLIQTAKSIPTTVAAGMATGTMFDAGDAIASGAEAVMQKLEGVLSGQIKAAELEADITNAETTVTQFLDKVDQVEKELRGKKAELDKALGKGRVLADYQPGGKIYAQFQEEERRLNETKKEMVTEIKKTEEQIENAQEFIDAADERELEIVYFQSVANGRAALGRLVSAYDQRDQLLGKLLSLKAQWEGVTQERQAAQELVVDFRRGLGERKQDLAAAKQAWTKSKEDREALSRDLQAQILAFDAERRELLKPARRMLTTELLEAMAPALALASLNALPQEQQESLDSANADLITIARWLYVLTGQQRMATLGAPCQSLYELKLARKEVARAWQEFHDRWSVAKLQTCVLTFSAADVTQYSVGNHLVFRTETVLPPGDEKQPVVDKRGWLFAASQAEITGPVWEYSPRKRSDGVPVFYLTHAVRQGTHGSLLHGVWAICEWPDTNGNLPQTVQNLPDAYPSLSRAGLVKVRGGSGLVTLPFYSPANDFPESGVLAPFSTCDDVRRHFLRLASTSSDLIASPLIDPLANRYFGHGLDQTWVFELREHRDSLQAVHIVLTHLLPPGRLQRDDGIGNLAGEIDNGFLTWLRDEYHPDRPPQPPPERKSIAVARQEAGKALRAYRDSPTRDLTSAQNALTEFAMLLKEERDSREAAQSALQNGLGRQHTPNASADAAAGLTSIVQPISLTDQLDEASALLNLLEQSLKKDHIEPLNKVADTLGRIRGHRDRLRKLAEKLREQNEHRKVLADYVDLLENIVETVRGENLTGFEQARLNTLLDGRAWDREVEDILWDKAADWLNVPNQRSDLVEYLLYKIEKSATGLQPVPWGRIGPPEAQHE